MGCRHKEHHVFAVTVHVSKVMGMGMDSIFMGVLEVSMRCCPYTRHTQAVLLAARATAMT
jgi:hypothetical protein